MRAIKRKSNAESTGYASRLDDRAANIAVSADINFANVRHSYGTTGSQTIRK